MKELIKVEINNGEQVISARELYGFLEVKTRYNDWFLRMCEYGFVESVDYTAITQKRVTAQGNETTYVDHAISLSMAKELSMIQRTEKGKQARLYFIECENKLKQVFNLKDSLLLNIIKSNSESERAVALNKYELEYVKPLEHNLEKTTKKLEHKQEVINGLVDEVKLKTQRQFLNEIIKMKGVEYIKDRWAMLYKAYEQNKKINLKARMESYNLVNSPKIKNKLQYIDEVAHDIPKLYSIAVKMFESDFKDKLKKYIDIL